MSQEETRLYRFTDHVEVGQLVQAKEKNSGGHWPLGYSLVSDAFALDMAHAVHNVDGFYLSVIAPTGESMTEGRVVAVYSVKDGLPLFTCKAVELSVMMQPLCPRLTYVLLNVVRARFAVLADEIDNESFVNMLRHAEKYRNGGSADNFLLNIVSALDPERADSPLRRAMSAALTFKRTFAEVLGVDFDSQVVKLASDAFLRKWLLITL